MQGEKQRPKSGCQAFPVHLSAQQKDQKDAAQVDGEIDQVVPPHPVLAEPKVERVGRQQQGAVHGPLGHFREHPGLP